MGHGPHLSPVLTLIAAVLATVAFGCASSPPPPYRDFDGADLPDERVARLNWRGIRDIEIDGKRIKADAWGNGSARLTPGEHKLRYGGTYGRSVMLGAPTSKIDQTAYLDLTAGHLYRIRRKRVYGAASASDVAWIEDATTGEVLDGLRP